MGDRQPEASLDPGKTLGQVVDDAAKQEIDTRRGALDGLREATAKQDLVRDEWRHAWVRSGESLGKAG
jgi:hypothetical protein